MKRSGSKLARLNRRYPWLKIVILIIVMEIIFVLTVVSGWMENGALRFEIPIEEQTYPVDSPARKV